MDNRLPAGLRGRVIFGKGNKVTIGDRIRRIRKKRRLTQAELAMMSGLSLSAIQGYEQGRYEPKRKSLGSIAEVFKIPVDELYDMPTQLGTNLAEVGTDCISRKAAIDALTEYGNGRAVFISVGEAVIRIEQLPPIQPKLLQPWEVLVAQAVLPQPKIGRWIHDGSKWANRWICSECGYKWFFDCIEGAYCPHCGADMRGEQDG